jgi:hypothetical protein
MARTTPADVKAISGSTVDDSIVEMFIDAATCMIDQVVANGSKATDPCLASAETFLSAHIMAGSGVDEGLLTKETFENYSKEVQRSVQGEGVLGTQYGVTANALVNGMLIDLDKRPAGVIFAGGA